MSGSEIFAVVILALASIILLIPVSHWLIYWRFGLRDQNPAGFPPRKMSIAVLLPMRNEAGNVRRKISEVLDEILPHDEVCIIVVDSFSSDRTMEISEQMLKASPMPSNRWSTVSATAPGKSHAINLALDHITSEFVIMMDADTKAQEGWLEYFRQSFSDTSVGAVSGLESPQKNTQTARRSFYRASSNKLRTWESHYDSTPILEGSLFGWRCSAVRGFNLNEKLNADDAQITLAATRNGYRTIVNPGLLFEDTGTPEHEIQRSIRRSQGLSRALFTNIDLCLLAPRRKSRSPIFHAFILYVAFPWALLGFFMTPATVLATGLFAPLSWPVLVLSLLPVLLALPHGRSLMWGTAISIIAHIHLAVGINHAVWDPDRSD